jgi:signal transduction histidine kinase
MFVIDSVQLANDMARLRGPTRLLIVDDDAVDREMYRRHLRADSLHSYVVIEAATAEEAIVLLDDGPYDCIVLDYRLPGADGLSVFEALRNSDSGMRLPPVIMMTGHGNEDVAVEAMKCGIADYVSKHGLTAKMLQRTISNAVEKWRLKNSLSEKNQRLAQVNVELKQRAAELQRVYHAVSHELKTPLTAVREFIALVLDGVAGPLSSDEMKGFLEHALDGCDQMSHQVNDLVDSTRLEMHKLEPRLEPVRVDRSVEFAMASIRQIAASKKIELVTSIAPGLPQVCADPVRFAQILGNLLGNAAKFTEAGGTIALSARLAPADPDRVEIAVADTGCGIAPEHHRQVFERLFQVPNTGDELMGSGLGLGLAIARELVRLHGGDLTVESARGVGSTFRFSVAVSASDPALPIGYPNAATLRRHPPTIQAGGGATISR